MSEIQYRWDGELYEISRDGQVLHRLSASQMRQYRHDRALLTALFGQEKADQFYAEDPECLLGL